MKRGLLAATAGAMTLALTLAACTGSGTQPTTSGTPSESQPIDITMTVWTGDENVFKAYQEFRADNPELGELTIQSLPFAEYVAQLTIQLTGGDAPDIGWIVESTFAAWVDSGALADISSLKADPDWKFDDVLPGLYQDLVGPNGELLAYPFVNTVHPIIYNKTAFEKAGVETPLQLFDKGEWTWQNLRRLAKEMVDSGEVAYGFDIPQFAFTSYNLFNPIAKGFGGVQWPDGNTCGLTSPQLIESFTFLHDMIFVDKSYAAPGSTPNFASGDTAMISNPPSILAQLADADFEFEMVAQPKGAVEYNPFFGQAAIAVFAAGDNPELATRLLGYFTSPRGAERLSNFYVPARSSELTPQMVANLNPLLTEEMAKRALIDPLEYAKPLPFPVNFPEIESATKPVLDGLWVENADIPAVAAAACAVADPLLK